MRRGLECSQTLKALLSPDIHRSGGTGRSKGSRTMSWMEYRTLWDGVSVALILRLYSERVEAKKGNRTQGMVGMSAKAAGQKRMREAVAIEYFRFASTAFGCPCLVGCGLRISQIKTV